MIDIHSHILPAIDDGSRNLDMTLSMLHMSAVSGVTDIAVPKSSSMEMSCVSSKKAAGTTAWPAVPIFCWN